VNPGTIGYAKPDPVVVGHEQAARRPVLVVSSAAFGRSIPELVLAVPLSSRDRGLPHHLLVLGDDTGLPNPTWALCEQVRAVSTARLGRTLGHASDDTVTAVRRVIGLFLGL
jgi:mRNA interferase MazF